MLRMLRKVLINTLVFPFTLASGLPCTCDRSGQEPLKFRRDGKFRILQLSDIHEIDSDLVADTKPESVEKSRKAMQVIELAVKHTKPDLVVFTGDNIVGTWEKFTWDSAAKTIRKIVGPIAERNIPLAVVFGNHDAELGILKEFQTCIFCEYKNCRMSMNAEEMSGCGTYNLTIKDSEGKKDIFNLWMFDSGDYHPGGGYNFVQTDQIEWYERTSTKLREKNGGVPLPSILFQHIIIPEVYDCLTPVPEGTPGAFRGDPGYEDKWYKFEDYEAFESCDEPPSPPAINNGQFDSWLRQGDVLAAVFGHDHINSFIVRNKGIRLIQSIGAGYNTYGNKRGGRIFDLDEKDIRNFTTRTVTIDELLELEWQ
jgi:hypothetical protein